MTHYELSFPAPHTHYIEVRASIPTKGVDTLEIAMAVWTPGSYLVREYAKDVEDLEVSTANGDRIEVTKTRKNRWSASSNDHDELILTYRVYARQMSTQGNWVDSEFAMLNGAPTFVVPAHASGNSFEITVRPHETWKKVVTGLPSTGDNTFRAEDWDHLIDSPIYVGNAPVHEFETGGAIHLLVNQGEENLWDGAKSAEATKAIVKETQRLWGTVPYERYVFFNMIVDGRGGLEHRNSTLLMTTRYAMRKRKEYVGWLTLVAHEFFHTWNVKRLRPAALGPFDYENEVHTRDLWIAEGITNYLEVILVRRAELITAKELLELASEAIEQLQTTPGRLVQSLSESSFDTWISLYRPNENSANTGVSYYLKGSVVALLLDAEIRSRSEGKAALDDVLRKAFEKYSGEKGYETAEFRKTASEVVGSDLSGWFADNIDDTKELDYSTFLDYFGLEFYSANEEPTDETEPQTAYLGIVAAETKGRLIVEQVRRDTPAAEAGLNAEDEIIAIDDYRLDATDFKGRIEHYSPGETVTILVSRRGKLERIRLTFGKEPEKRWRIRPKEGATQEQVARRKAWIGE